MKQVYSTFVLNADDGSEHPFLVCVLDMDILTEGDSFTNAIKIARDSIGLTGIPMEDNEQDIPGPPEASGALEKVQQDTEIIDFSKGILTYVGVDFLEYRRKVDTRTVRRNVALMSWLNYEDEHAGINVSRVL